MGDVALVGANGATDVTVAVAEEPRGRFGVPLAVISGALPRRVVPVARDRAARVDRARPAAAGHPRTLACAPRSDSAGSTGTVFFLATCYWIVYTIGHYTACPSRSPPASSS